MTHTPLVSRHIKAAHVRDVIRATHDGFEVSGLPRHIIVMDTKPVEKEEGPHYYLQAYQIPHSPSGDYDG